MSAPAGSLTEVYDELHNTLFRMQSVALLGQRGCHSIGGPELEGSFDTLYLMAGSLLKLLDQSQATFGYKDEP